MSNEYYTELVKVLRKHQDGHSEIGRALQEAADAIEVLVEYKWMYEELQD